MHFPFFHSELRCEISLRWNANGHCFISETVMTKGVELIYCRLVTPVLNWSNMLQTSSAERLHLSSAKKPLRNWDLGSSLHDLKPLTLFTVTGCQTRTHRQMDGYTNLHSSARGLPGSLVVIVAEIDIVCCSAPLFVTVFPPILVIIVCFALSRKLNTEQPLHHVRGAGGRSILWGSVPFLWRGHGRKKIFVALLKSTNLHGVTQLLTFSWVHKPAQRGTDGYCQHIHFERLGWSQAISKQPHTVCVCVCF